MRVFTSSHRYCPFCGKRLEYRLVPQGPIYFKRCFLKCTQCERLYVVSSEYKIYENYTPTDQMYNRILFLDPELFDLTEYIRNLGAIDKGEYTKLLNTIHVDRIARNRFIEINLEMVLRCAVAEEHIEWHNIADAIQNGIIALIELVDSWHSGENNGIFGIQAKRYIKARIKQTIQSQWNSLSDQICERQYFRRILESYYEIYGRNGFASNYERQNFIRQIAAKYNLSDKMISECLSYIEPPIYLSEKYEGDNSECGLHATEDAIDIFVNDNYTSDQIKKLNDALFDLNPVEAEVIRMRYGLDIYEGESVTLRECGERLSLSHERVRQIELMALSRLKIILDA